MPLLYIPCEYTIIHTETLILSVVNAHPHSPRLQDVQVGEHPETDNASRSAADFSLSTLTDPHCFSLFLGLCFFQQCLTLCTARQEEEEYSSSGTHLEGIFFPQERGGAQQHRMAGMSCVYFLACGYRELAVSVQCVRIAAWKENVCVRLAKRMSSQPPQLGGQNMHSWQPL